MASKNPNPLKFSHFTASTCLGRGVNALWDGLVNQQCGLKPCDFDDAKLDCWIGEVEGLRDIHLPPELASFDCRNNRLALLGLEADGFAARVRALTQQYGASRIGVFLGTSTSGVYQAELAYRDRDSVSGQLPASFVYATTHNNFSLSYFVREYFQLSGPAHVISSACSSSAKVFVTAQQMIELGLIDAAIVGGVDSLCLTTLYGFHSLELTSPQSCKPYDRDRSGLSLGEAAAFVLLERDDGEANAVRLLGYGESSDAHHMSTPHPDGLGAQMAMLEALERAGLQPQDIDYLNLHGTATPNNDAAEGKAIGSVFGEAGNSRLWCNSTKGSIGHTLGAAGGVEAVICALTLQNQCLPGGVGTQICDPQIPINYLLETQPANVRYVQSNSFGFGGTNCSLVLGLEAGSRS